MAGMKFKTGLLPSPEPPKLKFGDYLKPRLPPIPAAFGHQDLMPRKGWGMLANGGPGAVSNCTVAGAMHCIMLWHKVSGRHASFSSLDAKADYFAITGGADEGADMGAVSSYWRNTGFRDTRARRHKIVAYVQVDARLDYIDAACYWFDAVGLGVGVANKEEEEFMRGQPWLQSSGANLNHYVPMVGKADYRKIVTWGGLQDVGDAWLEASCGEVVAMISEEALSNGKSSEGFDMAALQADLQMLG